MKKALIFGREPAVWVGVIEAFLATLLLLPFANKFGLTQESTTLILATVSGLAGAYTAFATKDTGLGWALGLAKGIVGLLVYYGISVNGHSIDPSLQASILSTVALLVGVYQRTQTSPVDAAVSGEVPVPVVPVDEAAPEATRADYKADVAEVPIEGGGV